MSYEVTKTFDMDDVEFAAGYGTAVAIARPRDLHAGARLDRPQANTAAKAQQAASRKNAR